MSIQILLIWNPIPKYEFHLNNYQIVDYYDNIPIKAERVVLIVELDWEDRLRYNMIVIIWNRTSTCIVKMDSKV